MNKFYKTWISWMFKGGRPLHMLCSWILAWFLGIIPVIVAAFAIQLRDWIWCGCKGIPGINSVEKTGFDWLDILAALISGTLSAGLCAFLLPSEIYIFTTGVF